ncbi:hypothetical protein Ahy_B08g093397 [Arachis hypogaea]|uniref:Uncharacterized protein n=1 Tax=Arachis hypogaea TaxID=3818 RepID=A0A444Y5Z9_ARAHY|nr:hypothetical protein Ahy_B08g093397 [Arachis hypogaea]
MSIGRGATDQATGRCHSRGRGRGRVPPRTFGSSPSTLSTLVMPQVVDLAEQPFIMVFNLNYVPLSRVTTLPPIAQQLASTLTPPPMMDATAPESIHDSKAAADAPPPPPPIVWLKIWPDGDTGLILVCAEQQRMYSGVDQHHQVDVRPPLAQLHEDPAETKERWFQKWLHFKWDVEHDLTIRKIFDHRMDIKKALFVHWETDEGFRHRCFTNRANSVSVRSSKYTGGSVTFMKTKVRQTSLSHCFNVTYVVEIVGSRVTLAETFKYTHMLKENKEAFAYQWSQNHYVRILHTETRDRDLAVSVRWGGCRRWLYSCSRRSRCDLARDRPSATRTAYIGCGRFSPAASAHPH